MKKRGDRITVVWPLIQVDGQGSNPVSPLQLEIVKINTQLAYNLNKLWHSRLPNTTINTIIMNTNKICFGAKYKNIWFASAIWTDPIARAFNGKNLLELRRMAICKNSPKNTASRMLSIMTKIIKKELPHIWKLISYQDTEVHTGTIYKASNWESVGLSRKANWYHPTKKYKSRKMMTNPIVAGGPKIRWEKQIRPEPKDTIKHKLIKHKSRKGLNFG